MAMIERYFLQQNYKKIELERYLRKELDKAGFTMLEVVKTPLVTRIVLHVTRPGLAIGKGGQNIRQLTKDIEEKFGITVEDDDLLPENLDSVSRLTNFIVRKRGITV